MEKDQQTDTTKADRDIEIAQQEERQAMTNDPHIPGNKFHDRAENIRLMIASLADNHDTGQPERSTTELLLFEISDRLAAITFELSRPRRRGGTAVDTAAGPVKVTTMPAPDGYRAVADDMRRIAEYYRRRAGDES